MRQRIDWFCCADRQNHVSYKLILKGCSRKQSLPIKYLETKKLRWSLFTTASPRRHSNYGPQAHQARIVRVITALRRSATKTEALRTLSQVCTCFNSVRTYLVRNERSGQNNSTSKSEYTHTYQKFLLFHSVLVYILSSSSLYWLKTHGQLALLLNSSVSRDPFQSVTAYIRLEDREVLIRALTDPQGTGHWQYIALRVVISHRLRKGFHEDFNSDLHYSHNYLQLPLTYVIYFMLSICA